METLLVLILVVATLILACVAMATYDIRSMRTALNRGVESATQSARRGPMIASTPLRYPHRHFFTMTGAGNFVIWVWSEGRWSLMPGAVPDGVDPGPPPSYPGAFEKHHVRTWVSEAG